MRKDNQQSYKYFKNIFVAIKYKYKDLKILLKQKFCNNKKNINLSYLLLLLLFNFIFI